MGRTASSLATFGDPIPLTAKTSRSITVSASRRHGPRHLHLAGLYYSYPGDDDIGYFEAWGGASWTGGAWTLSVNDYWSPDNAQFFGEF